MQQDELSRPDDSSMHLDDVSATNSVPAPPAPGMPTRTQVMVSGSAGSATVTPVLGG